MGLFDFLAKNKEIVGTIWKLIQPFVKKLVDKNVPKAITGLYENLAKYTQPAVDSLFKLKYKINLTPNSVDNYCFNQGVNALDTFASYLKEQVDALRA